MRKGIIQFLGTLLGFGVIFGILLGIDHLKRNFFVYPEVYIIGSFLNGVYVILTLIIVMIIVSQFIEKLIKKKWPMTKRAFLKIFIPLLILWIPIAYLNFDHYITIGNKGITYDPFWSLENQDYSWEEIQSVALSEPLKKYGKYYIYFDDERKINLWKGGARLDLYELKMVDEMIRDKGIPKYYDPDVTDQQINNDYSNPEKFKIAKKIFKKE